MKLIHRRFRWFPRILSILAISFISLFAADSFRAGIALPQQITDFFMHLIPSFILIAILILSWKRELLGGIIFLVVGLAMSPFVYLMNYNRNHNVLMSLGVNLVITVPFIIIGFLFIVSSYLAKKEKRTTI